IWASWTEQGDSVESERAAPNSDPFNKYARLCRSAVVLRLCSHRRQHPLPEHRESLAHRAIHYGVADLDDHPAEDGRVERDVRHHAFAEDPRQLPCERVTLRLGRLA